MASQLKILPNYNYNDYLNWEGRWEVIDGIPFAMSPAPRLKHQSAAGKIHSILINSLTETGCGHCNVYQPIDLKITENTIVQPDLSIICGVTEDRAYIDFPPALVIEILSPSTALKDKNTKYELYQNFDIPYYLIFDLELKEILAYHLTEKKYQLFNYQKQGFKFEDGCFIKPNLEAVFE